MAVESSLSKATVFRALHQDGVFVIPNPWDIGTARILESLGFPALATTSSGFAQSLGRADGQVTLDEKLEHCRSLAAATRVPISVDTENCFGDSPEEVATCIRRVAETGVVGASVEDYTGDPSAPLYDFTLAVESVCRRGGRPLTIVSFRLDGACGAVAAVNARCRRSHPAARGVRGGGGRRGLCAGAQDPRRGPGGLFKRHGAG